MTVALSRSGEHIVITFPFDAYLLRVVRALPARRYDPNRKHWTIPVSQARGSVERLAMEGFTIAPEVWQAVDSDDTRAQALGELRGAGDAELVSRVPLRPYQRAGVRYLALLGSGLLADEVGLGKTIQALAVADVLQAKRILVLTQSVLKDQWASEIARFLGEPAQVVQGARAQRMEQWRVDVRWTVANYEQIRVDAVQMPQEWDMIIADEATRISNPWTKTYRALRKLTARYRLALTGTPVSNRPDEVWGIIDWLKPGVLGSYPSFLDRYCIRAEHHRGIVGYRHLDELAQRVQPLMIRRLQREVLTELPEKTYIDVPFTPSPEERRVYKTIRMELMHELMAGGTLAKVENIASLQHTLVKLTRLRQAADSLELLGDSTTSTKLEVLKEIIQQVTDDGRKVIVFTEFAQMAEIIARELAQYQPCVITGSVDKRTEVIQAFTGLPQHKVLVMTSAGQYGLNIQAASVVVHYDQPWSIAKLEQRNGRAHRMGQERAVLIYRLLARGTVDTYIRRVLHNKEHVSNTLLGDKVTPKHIEELLTWNEYEEEKK